MRIVIDATAAVGGGRVYLTQLLSHAARLATEHEFIIFHTVELEDLAALASGPQFQWRRVALPASSASGWLGAGLLKMLWRLIVLPLHLHRLQPDLIFSNAGFGPGWRPVRARLVVALHNSMPLQEELIAEESSPIRRWRLALLRRLIERSARRCDGMIVFSEDLKQRMVESFAHLKAEPAVIYHGIEWGAAERNLQPAAEQLAELGIRQPYLLYVSHFHRYKNALALVEGFALVLAEHPEVTLVLVGEPSDKAYWQEVQREAARLGIAESVQMIPGLSREDLKEVYRGALAFVYPSLAENCPFALLEAMACGLPVASALATSLPEIAREAAVYFDPHNPAEIAEVLSHLIGDPSLREELSQKAVRRAQGFSWERAAQQTLHAFEQVVESDQAQPSAVGHQPFAD
jgi:glycosyltransferase involved in cell wall biosynthesis